MSRIKKYMEALKKPPEVFIEDEYYVPAEQKAKVKADTNSIQVFLPVPKEYILEISTGL